MVKIFCCLMVITLLTSCGEGGDITLQVGPVILGPNINIPPNIILNLTEEGFQPRQDNVYGFDYSPDYINNRAKKEDSIVYVSIPKNVTGYVNVFTDTSNGSYCEYYYCDPEDYTELLNEVKIPTNEIKHTYKFTSASRDIIALCKRCSLDESREKIQELHIKSYDYKSYDFYVHIFASGFVQDQLLNNSFWGEFDNKYRQAIVKRGNISTVMRSAGNKKFKDNVDADDYLDAKTEPRNYILSRAEGVYGNNCAEGDIGRAIDTILNAARGGLKRAIIYVNYKTKRFWPLTSMFNDIRLCGTHNGINNDPTIAFNLNLELEPLPDAHFSCPTFVKADVIYEKRDLTWYLDYRDGKPKVVANRSNANPDCVVFADKNIQDHYIGEIPGQNNLEAATLFYDNASIVILPSWLGNKTARVAYHELGHTMGLFDIDDDASFSSKIGSNSDQSNLMHYDDEKIGYKLRNRSMVQEPKPNSIFLNCKNRNANGKCIEHQWDCLHEGSYDACIDPTYDPYNY